MNLPLSFWNITCTFGKRFPRSLYPVSENWVIGRYVTIVVAIEIVFWRVIDGYLSLERE